MSQRLKVQEVVLQMYEKNLVLTNMLRDIIENETSARVFSPTATDEEFSRSLNDRAARRLELVAEIEDYLYREDAALQVSA